MNAKHISSTILSRAQPPHKNLSIDHAMYENIASVHGVILYAAPEQQSSGAGVPQVSRYLEMLSTDCLLLRMYFLLRCS